MTALLALLGCAALAQDVVPDAADPTTVPEATGVEAPPAPVVVAPTPKPPPTPVALDRRLLGADAPVAPAEAAAPSTATVAGVDLADAWGLLWPLGLVGVVGGGLWLAKRRGFTLTGVKKSFSLEDVEGPSVRVVSRTPLVGTDTLLLVQVDGLDAPHHLLVIARPGGSELLQDLTPHAVRQPAPQPFAQTPPLAPPVAPPIAPPPPTPVEAPVGVMAGAAAAAPSPAPRPAPQDPSPQLEDVWPSRAQDEPAPPRANRNWRAAAYQQSESMDLDDDNLDAYAPSVTDRRRAPAQDEDQRPRPTAPRRDPARPRARAADPAPTTPRRATPPRPHLEALTRGGTQSRRRSPAPDPRASSRTGGDRRERTEAARALLEQMIARRQREHGA